LLEEISIEGYFGIGEAIGIIESATPYLIEAKTFEGKDKDVFRIIL